MTITPAKEKGNGVSEILLESYNRKVPYELIHEYLDYYGGLEALKSKSVQDLDVSHIESYLKIIVGKKIGAARLSKVYIIWLDKGYKLDYSLSTRGYLKLPLFINFLEKSSIETLTEILSTIGCSSGHTLIDFIRPRSTQL